MSTSDRKTISLSHIAFAFETIRKGSGIIGQFLICYPQKTSAKPQKGKIENGYMKTQ